MIKKKLRLISTTNFEDFSRFFQKKAEFVGIDVTFLSLSLKQAEFLIVVPKWPLLLQDKQPAVVNAKLLPLPAVPLPPRHPRPLASGSANAGHVTWSAPTPSASCRRQNAVPREATRRDGITSAPDNISATNALSTSTGGEE